MSEDTEQWVPRTRETWPWRVGTLQRDVMGEHYLGYWNDNGPVMRPVPMKRGDAVKIVMVSRFGDVGITPNLDEEFGYVARVEIDDLQQI